MYKLSVSVAQPIASPSTAHCCIRHTRLRPTDQQSSSSRNIQYTAPVPPTAVYERSPGQITLERRVLDIDHWMSANRLKLNADKTELQFAIQFRSLLRSPERQLSGAEVRC